ncbi:hypothetical protein [Secundilactobacillus paracollinoides]|uniref:hypothetical protein n=1 Tax=Secundilactobacillus paracollinoides TaxID=240427 RepID=UPI0006CFC72F|nr:hypothetical protein [Secundilactobacillus paracollinoides]
MKSDAAVGNVTINYDNAAGQVVGTYNWGVPVSALKSGAATTTGTKLSDILTDPTSVWSTAVKNVPAGYTVTNSSTVADNATLGGSFSVQVIPANTAQTVSFFSTGSGQALVGTTNPTLSAADKALLSGKTGETIPASTWTSAASYQVATSTVLLIQMVGLTPLMPQLLHNVTRPTLATLRCSTNNH